LRRVLREEVKRVLSESKRYGNSRSSRRLTEAQFKVGQSNPGWTDYSGDWDNLTIVAGPLSASEVLTHKLATVPSEYDGESAIDFYENYFKRSIDQADGPFYILEMDADENAFIIYTEKDLVKFQE
jgi:hypothetical protein